MASGQRVGFSSRLLNGMKMRFQEVTMIPKVKVKTVDGWQIGRLFCQRGLYYLELDPKIYRVDDLTRVCMGTGIFDFCGAEIFEGDILHVRQKEAEVKWQQREGRWVYVCGTEVAPLAKVPRTAYVIRNKWDEVDEVSQEAGLYI